MPVGSAASTALAMADVSGLSQLLANVYEIVVGQTMLFGLTVYLP